MTVQHDAGVEPQVEWIARYLSQVECRYCGTAVYPGDESDETAVLWVSWDVRTIEDVRSLVERTCSGCAHFLDKDD